jgi:hypothetical protein
MRVMKTNSLLAIALAFMFFAAAFGQEAPKAQTAKPDDYVTEKGFKSKVFEVKQRDPDRLITVLRPLGSGFKGATLVASRDFKIITVRDFPENIAAMEEALQRLDKPEAPAPDIELLMHILMASNTGDSPGRFPDDLNNVILQLRSTLNYKSYHIITSVVQRVRDSGGWTERISGVGNAQIELPFPSAPSGASAEYMYRISEVSLIPSPSSGSTVQFKGFYFRISGSAVGTAEMRTDIGVRDGEKVVVGTATLKDKGLIIVLSAKVIK